MRTRIGLLIILSAAVHASCSDDDGDDSGTAGSGGTAAQAGSGGTAAQAGSGGTAAQAGSGGTAAQSGMGGSAASAGLGGTGGGLSGAGGSAGTGGGTGGMGAFACGTSECQPGEQYCLRVLPALPGDTGEQTCTELPSDCAVQDCSCFCTPTQPGGGCTTDDLCFCTNQSGRLTLVCASP